MPDYGNLNLFESWFETINDAVVAVKQLTSNGIIKFRHNSS